MEEKKEKKTTPKKKTTTVKKESATKKKSTAVKKTTTAKKESVTKKKSTTATKTTVKKKTPVKKSVIVNEEKKVVPKVIDTPKEEIIKEEKVIVEETQNVKPNNKGTVVLIIACALLFMIFITSQWYKTSQEKLFAESYLKNTDAIVLTYEMTKDTTAEDIKQIFSEVPNEYFILINYKNNKETYNLEKDLKSIIDQYNLSDKFYSIDVTKVKDDENYLRILNIAFATEELKTSPTIIYVKDKKIVSEGIVSRDDNNIINAGDFQKLLDIIDYQK